MLSQKQIGILGTGAYVPEAVLSNQDLEKLVETSAEWIVERSGIHERRIAAPEENSVTMAVLALAVCVVLYLRGMSSPEAGTIGMMVSLASVPLLSLLGPAIRPDAERR